MKKNYRFNIKTILSAVMALVSLHIDCYADQLEQNAFGICIAAAKEQFEFFEFDDKVLKSQCECVNSKRNGEMPIRAFEWKKGGKTSAIHTLVECAQSEIISFYSGTELKGEMTRLEKEGLKNDTLSVQKAENYSACIGEVSYKEILRVATITNPKTARLNKARYLRMYRLCEAASNSQN